MLRKVFEGTMFGALVAVAAVWVAMWASTAFGQVAGVQGPSTGTGYPNSANNLQVAATGTVGVVTATLPAQVGQFTYICGFAVSFVENATGGTTSGPITVVGLDATFTYQQTTQAASTAAQIQQNFTPCLPASAQNTAITVNTTANAQAAAVDVNAWGYQIPAN